LLDEGGEIVAITPRSFCNGPYFLPFRRLLLEDLAIRQVHSFGARDLAFKDDHVLQENVILFGEKGPQPAQVMLSSSLGFDFAGVQTRLVRFDEVVAKDDPGHVIHIPVLEADSLLVQQMRTLECSLADLGISVSTGPVVDFRVKPFLHYEPEEMSVPLIYPAHFHNGFVAWPKANGKKANAIDDRHETRKWLMPQGHYTLTRRFSSKEERRRIYAAVYDPGRAATDWVGFENHLNVFHDNGHGLPPLLARGLAVYLNSTVVDRYFRLFNGHTQVNAADLRARPYPERDVLIALGAETAAARLPLQDETDRLVDALVFHSPHQERLKSLQTV
jgi:adenine-specific DNA-methyltransferase